jgi:microcystin-dependent protein
MVGHTDYYIGDLKWSVQPNDHEYWLRCDGRSLDRTRFPALFELLGTTYGSDSGETFKLPDCRGRVVGCIGAGAGLTTRSSGASIGAETHTLTISEIPSHEHGVTDPGHAHTITDPGHSHTVNNTLFKNGLDTPSGLDDEGNEFNTTTSTTTTSSSSTTGISVNTNTTGISINATGGGEAHNNMQPTIFIGHVFIAYKNSLVY